jgi:hypothetical protein
MSEFASWLRILFLPLAAAIGLLHAGSASATQTSAITVVPAPEGQGEIHSPPMRLTVDLIQDYVEEEFFVSGVADIYTYAETPVRGTVLVQPVNAAFPQTESIPYTTRMIVIRPASAADFSGTVAIEWWNSTAGFDTAPVWDPMAEFVAREGWVYVGVTNSSTPIDFLKTGCNLLGFVQVANCQTRYSALSLPANGLAYDMMSQIAHALRDSSNPNNPLPAGFDVERLYHAGQSQQGGSMVTYASDFHFADNDGYFVQAASSGRSINFGPACGAEGSPAYPECTPRLGGADRLVRTDLPVPVVRTLTETDVGGVLANGLRQSDTASFRYYEIAGASHVTVHKDIQVVPGILLSDFCLNPMNTLADGPVIGSYPQRAMWKNMDEFVRNGTPMPAGLVLATTATNGIARGLFGNALGGVRTTDMQAQLNRYAPNNVFDPSLPPLLHSVAQLACRLSGSVFPFSPSLKAALYPTQKAYVNLVASQANALVAQGFLLPKDRELVLLRAMLTNVACGVGMELALVLPPILWLRQRRRRRHLR